MGEEQQDEFLEQTQKDETWRTSADQEPIKGEHQAKRVHSGSRRDQNKKEEKRKRKEKKKIKYFKKISYENIKKKE